MTESKLNYKHTIIAGYISYITQAVVNNFTPLLFVTFQRDYDITLSQLAFISTYNFAIQLFVDIAAAKYAEKAGVKRSIVFAHIMAASGLTALGVLPYILQNKFLAILISITMYAFGGGLIEVLASPIIEACPTENKEANMSLLHSFYCWGQVFTVILSTVFFSVIGLQHWRYMAFIWAVIPAVNAIYFSSVPIRTIDEQNTDEQDKAGFSKNKLFLILVVMMLCAGASEISIAQWASAFVEESLGITKTAGDIAGPCMFALLMGISRALYAKFSTRISLEKYILFCAVLCCCGYLVISLSPIDILSLIGCGICGFAVGIMWPGTYSIAAKRIKNPSTKMFAFFALAGDMGCSTGPFIVGRISESCGNNLKAGILTGTVFPFVMIIAVVTLLGYIKKQKEER